MSTPRAYCSLVTMLLMLPLCNAQIGPRYTVTNAAGNGTHGFAGDGGAGVEATLNYPQGTAVDSSGNLFIADCFNHRVRKLTAAGTITTVAGNGEAGYSGDGGAGTSAKLQNPCGIAVDNAGNLFIADTSNHVIRKLTPGGTISTYAGNNAAGYSGDSGAATQAQLFTPVGLAVDSQNNLYIADSANHRIRKVAANGTITTFAGNGLAGFQGDGGPALDSMLNCPRDVAVDREGNVYIADTDNHRIRKVSADSVITTIAGTAHGGFAGDEASAIEASLYYPKAVDVNSSGQIAIADTLNSRIRMITVDGKITTIAGDGSFGDSGDGGLATKAHLRFPSGVAWSGSNLFVTDDQNSRIRKLIPVEFSPVEPPSIRSAGVVTSTAFGGTTTAAPGSWIEIYGEGLASTSRLWSTSDFNGAEAPMKLDDTTVTIGGRRAFLSFVSPDQVNAQIPSDVAAGPQAITVSNGYGTSAPYTLEITHTQPGLLAPPSLRIDGRQYVAATIGTTGIYALQEDAVPGIPSRPAHPGETLTMYGIGFGPVIPAINAGEVVRKSNVLTSTVQVLFGQTPAVVSYTGLALLSVGMYQLNVVVPSIATPGPIRLSITVGGAQGTQELYVYVQE